MRTEIAVSMSLAMSIAAVGFEWMNAQEARPDYVVVSSFNVNLRTGPGLESVVIGLAQKGDLFVCTGDTGDFFKIRMFSENDRYISRSHAYPLTRSQIVPGHRLRLPASDSTARSLFAGIQWASDRSEIEATELLPASLDSTRHAVLRRVLFDRLVLGMFRSHGDIQPAIYGSLLADMGVGRDTMPTVDQILERYIDAIGGRDAIERLTTRVMTGRLITDLPSESPPVYEEAEVEIRAATSHGYVSIMRTADETVWDGYDGQKKWSRNQAGVRIHDRADVRYAWLRDPRGALRLWEYFPGMTLRGSAVVDGRRVYVVDVDDVRLHAFYFDVESGLLVRTGYNREVGDYREVDGVMVPFRVAESRQGGSSTYVFDEIEHNVEVDVEQFVAPDTGREQGGRS